MESEGPVEDAPGWLRRWTQTLHRMGLGVLVSLAIVGPTFWLEETWHGAPLIDRGGLLWLFPGIVMAIGFFLGGAAAGVPSRRASGCADSWFCGGGRHDWAGLCLGFESSPLAWGRAAAGSRSVLDRGLGGGSPRGWDWRCVRTTQCNKVLEARSESRAVTHYPFYCRCGVLGSPGSRRHLGDQSHRGGGHWCSAPFPFRGRRADVKMAPGRPRRQRFLGRWSASRSKTSAVGAAR